MRVHRMIIHNIPKEAGQAPGHAQLSSELLRVDEQAISVAERLANAYGSRDIVYAQFKNEPDTEFPAAFRTFLNDDTDESFLIFSQSRTRDLYRSLLTVSPARGGYLVYLDYTQGPHRFVAVFLVRDTEGVIFRHDEADEQFTIASAIHIDIDKLAMAGRFNVGGFRNHEVENYISFIKRGAQDFSDYFVTWISASQLTNSRVYTDQLYRMTNVIVPPGQDGERLDRDEFRQQIHNYITSQPNRMINLRSLSEHFYGDPDYVPSFMDENDLHADTEFRAHSSGLSRFTRVDVKADGIQLKFSRGDALNRVRVEGDHLVVLDSEALAQQVQVALDERG